MRLAAVATVIALLAVGEQASSPPWLVHPRLVPVLIAMVSASDEHQVEKTVSQGKEIQMDQRSSMNRLRSVRSRHLNRRRIVQRHPDPLCVIPQEGIGGGEYALRDEEGKSVRPTVPSTSGKKAFRATSAGKLHP